MKIACLQFAPQVGDLDNNLNRADAVLSKASLDDLGLDLLVLPEMAFTGYNFKSLQDIAPFLEPSGSGITSLWARTTALKYNCNVTVGYPEKVDVSPKWPTGPEYYNSAIVVNGDGETIANYRKSFLYYTDETWALEGNRGFYEGFIPGLGNTSIGICMDLNPYKFEAPWHAFEFAFHVLEAESNLVIVSMAWMTREDRRLFTRQPNEPDMDTLTYWITRLEPLIRSENHEEIIVVFCNRCGIEDDVTFAGTSAVVGIQDGEVKVYGMLGRGERELLVVDTDKPPYAKLIYQPQSSAAVPPEELGKPASSESPPTGSQGDQASSPHGEAESPHQGGQPDTPHSKSPSVTDRSTSSSRFAKPPKSQSGSISDSAKTSLPANTRSRHISSCTALSPSSSLTSASNKRKTRRRQPPAVTVPDRLALTPRSWPLDTEETDNTNIPTPSAPSPTPMAIRPRVTIPDSSYGLPRACHPENPISAASQSSERSVQSVKSNESEASTVTVRSNPRPPEDSTPYPHSGAPRSAFWNDRTQSSYGNYLSSDGSRQLTSSYESSSESPCWFWRPSDSFLRTPAPTGPGSGTPVGRKPEPFPWGFISSPTAGCLDSTRETSHARNREALPEEAAEHRKSPRPRASSKKASRSTAEKPMTPLRDKKAGAVAESPSPQGTNRPRRKDASKSTAGQHATSATVARYEDQDSQQTISANKAGENAPWGMPWDTPVPGRPSSPKSRNCSRSRPSDPAEFYRDFQTIPIFASQSILDKPGLHSRKTPELDSRQLHRSMSRMGHRPRSNSMTNAADIAYPSSRRSGMANANRALSRGRQPWPNGSTTLSDGAAGTAERTSSVDSIRNANLHSRFRKRSSTTDGDGICRRSSYRSGSRPKTRPSGQPDGREFERYEAIVCPNCPVHGRQAFSPGSSSDEHVDVLPASIFGESTTVHHSRTPGLNSAGASVREMIQVKHGSFVLKAALEGRNGAYESPWRVGDDNADGGSYTLTAETPRLRYAQEGTPESFSSDLTEPATPKAMVLSLGDSESSSLVLRELESKGSAIVRCM